MPTAGSGAAATNGGPRLEPAGRGATIPIDATPKAKTSLAGGAAFVITTRNGNFDLHVRGEGIGYSGGKGYGGGGGKGSGGRGGGKGSYHY